MWKLQKPSDRCFQQFLGRQADAGLSYHPHAGETAADEWPTGFDHDRNRVRLGDGEAVFAAACEALRHWRQFPAVWTRIFPSDALLETGTTVVMVAHVFRQWWLNACRIVYVVDDTTEVPQGAVRRFGFAYGTLREHVEMGEERFIIEQLADGSVWYDVRAFSRPRWWCARLAYPLVRWLQRRFIRDSQRAMKAAVASALKEIRVER